MEKIYNKFLKTNANKEVQYLKNLIEREELDKEMKELVSEFFLINSNFALQKFVPGKTLDPSPVSPYSETELRELSAYLKEHLPETKIIERF